MGKEKKEIVYKDSFNVGKYFLCLESKVYHWGGYDSGKMEDAPGDFYTFSLHLQSITNPNTLEKLALEMKIRKIASSGGFKKEITNEPEGYGKLLHKQKLKEFSSKSIPNYQLLLKKALKKNL